MAAVGLMRFVANLWAFVSVLNDMPRHFVTSAARFAKLLLGLALLPTGPARADLTAFEVIERSVSAYSQMDELAGRVDFTIVLPDGRSENKQLEYGRLGSSAFQALLLPDGSRGLELVAAADSIRASQFNVPNAYVEAAYEGDLPAALESIGATQVGLELAAPLAAAMTGDTNRFLRGLGFGVLGPLEIRGIETLTEAGKTSYHVDLVAENGSCTAFFDPVSFKVTGFSVVVGEEGHQVRGTGSFVDTPTSELTVKLSFDPRGRQVVADFAALEASTYPLGQPAPTDPVRTLEGDLVSLSDLRGSVVVLDFWATWCVPCWATLEEMEKLAEWAKTAGRPVVVFAVNTLEETQNFEQRKSAVRAFLEDREIGLPVLIDTDDSFFKAMHTPGLPSTILIAPDGTLARYHSGVLPDMAGSLRRQVEEILAGER